MIDLHFLYDSLYNILSASIEALRQHERFDQRGYVIREEHSGKMVGFVSAEVVEDGYVHIGPLAVAPSNQVYNMSLVFMYFSQYCREQIHNYAIMAHQKNIIFDALEAPETSTR